MWHKVLNSFFKIKDFILKESDPVLLLFLVLVTNYRFSFKIAAIVGIYLYRPNFKFERSGIIYFYVSMIILSLINLVFISGDFSHAHIIVVFAGCLIWLACLLVFHQMLLSIKSSTSAQLINTLKLLTVINFAVSLADLIKVMTKTGTLNPYNQVNSPPYGISSGDLIGGIFGDMHLVNMTICAMLLLFFISKQNFLYSLLALIPLLLTGSNLGTLITVLALFYLLTLRKMVMSYYIVFCVILVLIFYVKVTPENFDYLIVTFKKVERQITHKPKEVANTGSENFKKKEEALKRDKILLYLSAKYSRRSETDTVYRLKQSEAVKEEQQNADRIIEVLRRKDSLKKAKSRDVRFEFGKLKKFDLDRNSGKIISFTQTKNYLFSSYKNFFFGAGIGGFSSRLAFISSKIVSDSRILMAIPFYESQFFTNNHKAIFKYLLFLDDEYHSIANLPFCWYNELLGEYGVLGLVLFGVFYLGFFYRRINLLTLGRLLLALMLLFFLFDYWYERLSVIIVFELLVLMDIKTSVEKQKKISYDS